MEKEKKADKTEMVLEAAERLGLLGISEGFFTKYELEKSQNTHGAGNCVKYWDDGICKICRKNTISTCHVQGLHIIYNY